MAECIRCGADTSVNDLLCSRCFGKKPDPVDVSRARQRWKAKWKKEVCLACGEPFEINRFGDAICRCGMAVQVSREDRELLVEYHKEKDVANEIVKTGQFSLAPTNFEEAVRFADLLSKSSFVPKDFQGKPGDLLAAMQMGSELGLQPLQAIQNIAVINGRPTVYGDAALAIVTGSSAFESIDESDDGTTATCVLKRKGRPAITRKFSMDDAKKAGLLSKSGPWQSYPARMRQMRARSFAMRDLFPDVLKGVSTREEAQDIEIEVIRSEPAAVQAPLPVRDAEVVDDNIQGARTVSTAPTSKAWNAEVAPPVLDDAFYMNAMDSCKNLGELKSVGAAIKAAKEKGEKLDIVGLTQKYVARQAELKR